MGRNFDKQSFAAYKEKRKKEKFEKMLQGKRSKTVEGA
jgi:hypothetical protein